MTREEKDLLLCDLCARLPYGVKVHYTKHPDCTFDEDCDDTVIGYYCNLLVCNKTDYCLDRCKPYLRPLSSMTETEKEELLAKLPTKWNIEIDKFEDFYFDICEECAPDIELFADIIDWLNKKMFDFSGLIPKGHAIAVTEDNNPYKD